MKNIFNSLMTMFSIISFNHYCFAANSETPASTGGISTVGSATTAVVEEPGEAPMPKISEPTIPASMSTASSKNEKKKTAAATNDSQKALSSRKLEFDDQSVNALDPDYGKLDLTSIRDGEGGGGRLYPIRKSFKKEQQDAVRNWGIGE